MPGYEVVEHRLEVRRVPMVRFHAPEPDYGGAGASKWVATYELECEHDIETALKQDLPVAMGLVTEIAFYYSYNLVVVSDVTTFVVGRSPAPPVRLYYLNYRVVESGELRAMGAAIAGAYADQLDYANQGGGGKTIAILPERPDLACLLTQLVLIRDDDPLIVMHDTRKKGEN